MTDNVLAERERCAEVCRRQRMLLEAYCDPGRSRDPLPREKYVGTIAYLWECERDILGREPEEYKKA